MVLVLKYALEKSTSSTDELYDAESQTVFL